jgi:hypothetical protein
MTNIVSVSQPTPHGPGNWSPIKGPAVTSLEGEMPRGSEAKIEDEALRILSKCVPPTSPPQSDVGLVIGYVQSGKTMNFTTVCAMARDNGFKIIIIVTGTSVNLYDQSSNRVLEQLKLDKNPNPSWCPIAFDPNNPPLTSLISGILDSWNDQHLHPTRKKTILITVLKHHRHLDRLVEIFNSVSLTGVPTLIIDDEADQAGLNAGAASGRQTSTYKQLLSLRARFPLHTYLQYTATPQAPLLINIIDALSPSFVEVLTPGNGYTGGQQFFVENIATAIKLVPVNELWTPQAPLQSPPQTFLQAFSSFLVAAGAGEMLETDQGQEPVRSMLIHPHQATTPHGVFYNWTTSIRDQWIKILKSPSDPDYLWVIDLLRGQYNDLITTATLPDFDAIVARLPTLLGTINIQKINSSGGKTPPVVWARAYAHILVGGQAMDRGYTVRGLTTTYMPRPLGVGNADTLQQRARFFGYKKNYFGLCRVWLEQGAFDAFVSYVEHEESMRDQLGRHIRAGKNLKEWKRAFFIDSGLRPTRSQVLTLPIFRDNHGGEWSFQHRPHDVPDHIVTNRNIIEAFISKHSDKFSENIGAANRTPSQKHLHCSTLFAEEVLRDLLLEIVISDHDDSNRFTGLFLQIREALDQNAALPADVYIMSPGEARSRTRRPETDGVNPFQGANPATQYPGDQGIRDDSRICVQIHRLSELRPAGTGAGDTYFDVCLLAVFLPLTFGRDHLVQ